MKQKMGILSKISNKEKVPDELPDLALDELTRKIKDEINAKSVQAPKAAPPTLPPVSESQPGVIQNTAQPQVSQPVVQTSSIPPLLPKAPETQTVLVQNTQREVVALPPEKAPPSAIYNNADEKGFFKDLIRDLLEESENVDEMAEMYRNRFSADTVKQMREYWNQQKPGLLIKNMNSDLRARILESVEKLHLLEKEWQDAYFTLISKEESIREEEGKLRQNLSEFIGICKKSIEKGEGKAKQ